MRTLAALALLAGLAAADDKKGPTVEMAGMKAAAPADWKEEPPANNMRLTQFKLPKADGDADGAELVVFFFKGGGSGSADQNLERQAKKFEPAPGKDKVEVTVNKEFKVGKLPAVYQDVKGVFQSKFPPFAPNAKVTPKPGYRQLYVLFDGPDGQYYLTLLGPEKTVEKHKAAFDGWLGSFK